ncbi:MAG: hypothetical protein CSB03_00925 [Bacteroidia bacterium]|nr:MAG: hypothetical protein CSB03_00925 [Bacteroidia bacterium]
MDCSGFTQQVARLVGIVLPRDASQQIEKGTEIGFLAEAKVSDLAFFDNEEGRITHTGVLLGNDKIIHSSGKVRIDRIDQQGIFNQELQKYTHRLRVLKNIVG